MSANAAACASAGRRIFGDVRISSAVSMSTKAKNPQAPQARIVKCPQCGAPVRWEAASRWRPFCSERCKTLDLGAWAAEAYRVPVVERDDDLDVTRDADER